MMFWNFCLGRETRCQYAARESGHYSCDQPAIMVDSIKVAQSIYLLLDNEEIRDVIDPIGRKGVLLLWVVYRR
jgi:hypothetical protein